MSKERITITMDSKILEKVDKMVDGRNIRNRSHAIESLLTKTIGKKINTALILAGGKKTNATKKVKGNEILEIQIRMLRDFGIKNILISLGPKADKIMLKYGDGSELGVQINYLIEDKPKGTGGAVKSAENKLNSTFLILNADTIMNPNIDEILNFHKDVDASATLLLTTSHEPGKSGVVDMKGNKIVGFTEKPNNRESGLIYAGLAICEPQILDQIPKGKGSLEKDVFPKLAKNGLLHGYPFDGKIRDVGKE